MNVFKNFSQAYVSLLKDVYTRPEFECAPRDMQIKESLGVKFTIENPLDRIPYVKGRKFSISYMIAEFMWYLTGMNSTDWISNYSSFWKNISDDGVTANSAYGARIFKPHDRIAETINATWTQWDYVLNELLRDNDSRRAVVHIRVPQDSLLAKLDVPCTLTLQFFMRNDAVHLVVSMRSSDLILGLAYDVPAFTMFQELLASDLTKALHRPIGVGTYTHVSNSLHIYERHFDMVEKIISDPDNLNVQTVPMPPIPGYFFRQMLENLCYVENRIRNASSVAVLENIILKVKRDAETYQFSTYVLDWLYVLAAHRAGKLGDELLRENYMMRTVFSGYRFFKK